MSLIHHLESHLGPIDAGWIDDASRRDGLQIVSFSGGPISGVTAFCTLGMSTGTLRYPPTGRPIRQELLLMCRTDQVDGRLPALLDQVATECLDSGRALSLGQLIGPRGPIVQGASVEAFYVATPVYLPDSFGIYERPEGGKVVFGWLVPVTRTEAELVRESGGGELERLLESHDPDLLDLRRPSMPGTGHTLH